MVRREWKSFLAALIYFNLVTVSTTLPVSNFLLGPHSPWMPFCKASALPIAARLFGIEVQTAKVLATQGIKRLRALREVSNPGCTALLRDYPFGRSLTRRLMAIEFLLQLEP
jgi:hypothetical protein